MEYTMLSLDEVNKYIPEMERLNVSEIARGPEGVIAAYKKLRGKLPDEWKKKRRGFIQRTLPAYHRNPTYRRWLSLIAWFYKPPIKHEVENASLK
ncbi:MAG: hypothetical protein ACOYNN_17070 [Terrimicrobiaceae bacterium]